MGACSTHPQKIMKKFTIKKGKTIKLEEEKAIESFIGFNQYTNHEELIQKLISSSFSFFMKKRISLQSVFQKIETIRTDFYLLAIVYIFLEYLKNSKQFSNKHSIKMAQKIEGKKNIVLGFYITFRDTIKIQIKDAQKKKLFIGFLKIMVEIYHLSKFVEPNEIIEESDKWWIFNTDEEKYFENLTNNFMNYIENFEEYGPFIDENHPKNEIINEQNDRETKNKNVEKKIQDYANSYLTNLYENCKKSENFNKKHTEFLIFENNNASFERFLKVNDISHKARDCGNYVFSLDFSKKNKWSR